MVAGLGGADKAEDAVVRRREDIDRGTLAQRDIAVARATWGGANFAGFDPFDRWFFRRLYRIQRRRMSSIHARYDVALSIVIQGAHRAR